MPEYLVIALWTTLLTLLVFFALNKIFARRLGDMHQWVADLRVRQERMEKELSEIALNVQSLEKGDPRLARLGKQLGQLASDVQTERQTLEERLTSSETAMEAMSQRLVQLRAPIAIPHLDSDLPMKALASPAVREVLELMEQGVEPAVIARRTGLQLGEVDLIRSLHTFAHKEQART